MISCTSLKLKTFALQKRLRRLATDREKIFQKQKYYKKKKTCHPKYTKTVKTQEKTHKKTKNLIKNGSKTKQRPQ